MNSLFETYLSKKDIERKNPVYEKLISIKVDEILENENKDFDSLESVRIRNPFSSFTIIFGIISLIGFLLLSISLSLLPDIGIAAFSGVGIYILICGILLAVLSITAFF